MSSARILVLAVLLVAILASTAYFTISREGQNEQAETMGTCIVDMANRTVCVGGKVERIASLFSEATRMVIALGAGEKLVGITTFDLRDPIMARIYPELGQIPAIGTTTEPSYEEILKLKPDVILADARQASILDEIQSRTGVPVIGVRINVNENGASGVFTYRGFEIVGRVLGGEYEERGRQLASYLESKLNLVRNRTSTIPLENRLKVYIAFARTPLITNGHADPAASAGLVNVAYLPGRVWYPVSLEQVISWDPDIIVVHAFSRKLGNYTVQSLLEDPNWQKVRAVREGRVYNVIVGLYGWYPGMSVVNVMQLAKIAYPELFRDLDIEKEGNEIYKTLYGVDGFFTEISRELGLYVPEDTSS